MATGNVLAEGNLDKLKIIGPIGFNPASVGANTTSEQFLTVPGILPGDAVWCFKINHDTGLGIVNARASATTPNTVAVTFANCTASPIDAASQNFWFVVFRPDAGLTAF